VKFLRRSVAIFLASLAIGALVCALIVRVAYATVFDTDTYVETVSEVVNEDGLQSKIVAFATDEIVKATRVNDPSLAPLFSRAGLNQSQFQDTVTRIVSDSVTSFLGSEKFRMLWAETNRTAHTQLMALARSETPVTKDFMIDLGPIVRAAAAEIQDPTNTISKIIPLTSLVPSDESFEFKLIQASGVEDLRSAVKVADRSRMQLLIAAILMLALAWLVFGRARGAHRLVALSIFGAGLLTFVARAIGENVIGAIVNDDAKTSAVTIYTITTEPLTGYAVFVLMIGAVGFAATFYKRSND
jgi:hypothetical protein